MPVFYTHVLSGADYAQDSEGQELVDREAACESARRGARQIVSAEIAAGHDEVKLELHIDDEAGVQVGKLDVSAIVSGL